MISGACLLAGCLDCWCSNEDTSCVKSGVVQKTELQSSFTTCSLNLPFRCAARFADRFCTQSVHQLTTQVHTAQDEDRGARAQSSPRGAERPEAERRTAGPGRARAAAGGVPWRARWGAGSASALWRCRAGPPDRAPRSSTRPPQHRHSRQRPHVVHPRFALSVASELGRERNSLPSHPLSADGTPDHVHDTSHVDTRRDRQVDTPC